MKEEKFRFFPHQFGCVQWSTLSARKIFQWFCCPEQGVFLFLFNMSHFLLAPIHRNTGILLAQQELKWYSPDRVNTFLQLSFCSFPSKHKCEKLYPAVAHTKEFCEHTTVRQPIPKQSSSTCRLCGKTSFHVDKYLWIVAVFASDTCVEVGLLLCDNVLVALLCIIALFVALPHHEIHSTVPETGGEKKLAQMLLFLLQQKRLQLPKQNVSGQKVSISPTPSDWKFSVSSSLQITASGGSENGQFSMHLWNRFFWFTGIASHFKRGDFCFQYIFCCIFQNVWCCPPPPNNSFSQKFSFSPCFRFVGNLSLSIPAIRTNQQPAKGSFVQLIMAQVDKLFRNSFQNCRNKIWYKTNLFSLLLEKMLSKINEEDQNSCKKKTTGTCNVQQQCYPHVCRFNAHTFWQHLHPVLRQNNHTSHNFKHDFQWKAISCWFLLRTRHWTHVHHRLALSTHSFSRLLICKSKPGSNLIYRYVQTRFLAS